MSRLLPRGLLLSALTALVAACATPAPPPVYNPPPVYTPPPVEEPVERPEPEPETPQRPSHTGLTPAHLEGRELTRAALLLPFSSDNEGARSEALRLLNAAQLALFQGGDDTIVLIPKDTGGTESGARSAARAAITDGADIILGPLFGTAAVAAGEVAREYNIPVIAFSTDAEAAGNGVYLLSFPPDIEVARLVEYVSRQGASRFAYLGPSGRYGEAVSTALRDAARLNGADVVGEEHYSGGVEAMTSAAGRLARMGRTNLGAMEAYQRQARGGWTPSANAPFQAVILPEGGIRLRTLAPLLPYHDVDPLVVKFLGTGLWNDPETVREPALRGGWFAGPDPEARARFNSAYADAWGDQPSRIASHAYDAVLLTLFLARDPDGITRENIENPDGFYGADGLFRFNASGNVERGLAIFEVQPSGIATIDPAPREFELTGS